MPFMVSSIFVIFLHKCVFVCSFVCSCVCTCTQSSKQWLFPIRPEVMRHSEAPAECNEAPCSSTLVHQVSLCLSAQQACVCTAPSLVSEPHIHKHANPPRPVKR